MPSIYIVTIPDTAAQNLQKPRIRTNVGKQTIPFQAIDLWKELLTHFKELSVFAFSKKKKEKKFHLLSANTRTN